MTVLASSTNLMQDIWKTTSHRRIQVIHDAAGQEHIHRCAARGSSEGIHKRDVGQESDARCLLHLCVESAHVDLQCRQLCTNLLRKLVILLAYLPSLTNFTTECAEFAAQQPELF